MKNFLIFIFGAAFGVGGTLLWLRKDIKKELEGIKNQENSNDIPFVVDEKGPKTDKKGNSATSERVKTEYHKIIQATEEGTVTNTTDGNDETDGGIFEIDADDFMHNHDNEKERLVYFRGDRVMATEKGTIIPNPFNLIGGEWESCVGNYADRTAFIRNSKMVTDYEIYVEDGLYEDEFGSLEFND